jgi:perosamine synthetase
MITGGNMEVSSTKPFFSESDIQAITAEVNMILRNGNLILGPYTRKFEDEFAAYCGVKHAVAVSTCTAALQIALRYYDIVGADVIVPTNTFIQTSNAVIYSGGNPILVDIKASTLCLDPDDLLHRLTPRTKGVIVVHIAGLPCPDIDKIHAICNERGLFLLEDVAHAPGATINGRKTGTLANAGCFSFYPTKLMTTGTGGMLTTDDDRLAEYAISLRHYGVGEGLHQITNMGSSWLMDEISALLGIYQLKALDKNIARRNEIALLYSRSLADTPDILVLPIPSYIRHSYYKYPVFLSQDINKKDLAEGMKKRFGVSLGSVYDPPCHLQPVYQRLYGYYDGQFPVADTVLKHTCCLPIYSQMTDDEVDYVSRSLKTTLADCRAARVIV